MLCKGKIRLVKAQVELTLDNTINYNEKYFYKYIIDKRKGKENFHSSLNVGGNRGKVWGI